jgi:serine/threonine protein kinase
MEYNEQKLLGSGAYGKVFLSKDGKYAVKVSEQYLSCVTEYTYLKLLQGHPNIVKILETPRDLIGTQIILEKAECDLLSCFTEIKDCRKIGRQLFDGLAYIHKFEIIHSDIKLSNILVFKNKTRVAITDFGISETFSEDRIEPSSVTTLWNRAPELLALQDTWDEKIDIWSLGVVYYALLTGQNFLTCQTPVSCLAFITEKYGFLEFKNPPLPFGYKYWGEKTYTDTSPCVCLKLEHDDIIDASLIPIPHVRKTALEILGLFDKKKEKKEKKNYSKNKKK